MTSSWSSLALGAWTRISSSLGKAAGAAAGGVAASEGARVSCSWKSSCSAQETLVDEKDRAIANATNTKALFIVLRYRELIPALTSLIVMTSFRCFYKKFKYNGKDIAIFIPCKYYYNWLNNKINILPKGVQDIQR
jgi:hypothetical protein